MSAPNIRPPFVFSADGRQIIGGREGIDTIEFTAFDVRSAKVRKKVIVMAPRGLSFEPGLGPGSGGGTCGGVTEASFVLSRTGKWGAVSLFREGQKAVYSGAWWKPSVYTGVLLFNAQTGKHIRMLSIARLPTDMTAWRFSEDEKTLIVTGTSGLQLWDVQTGQLQWSVKDKSAYLYDIVALSADNRMMACADGNADSVILRDMTTGRVKRRLKAKKVSYLAFSLDGSTLAMGHHNGTVTLWRLR